MASSNMPPAFRCLLRSENSGKPLVRLADCGTQ
jgi:hypothetical protein